jgi:large subunit GTPase 1
MKQQRMSAIQQKSQRHTFDEIKSITQENDLEAFLTTATLAGTEFTAEKLNVTVVTKQAPFLLTKEQIAQKKLLFDEHNGSLKIPRRPHWDSSTTPEQLKVREQNSFLEWRRSLVFLEEEKGLLLTPYERNLEVWRQLWRVIERSELLVQIVDARNPLFFQCPDLDVYVREVDVNKKSVLLVNKADLLSVKQRCLA